MTLDEIVQHIHIARFKREVELRKAFSDQHERNELILRDCAELIAGIGGYTAPLDFNERREWITRMMRYDAAFVAKVRAAANLVSDYVDYAYQNASQGTGEGD